MFVGSVVRTEPPEGTGVSACVDSTLVHFFGNGLGGLYRIGFAI